MRSALLLLLSISACDGGTTINTKSGNGTITVTSPMNAATVTVPATTPNLPVSFTVSGFTLKDAGSCAGSANCGHVHITIDGATCNDPNAEGPYNADGFASPIEIHFDKCPMVAGAHKITAELHNDDHSTYTNPAGTAVTSVVNITVQ
jgi:hypothetical protein